MAEPERRRRRQRRRPPQTGEPVDTAEAGTSQTEPGPGRAASEWGRAGPGRSVTEPGRTVTEPGRAEPGRSVTEWGRAEPEPSRVDAAARAETSAVQDPDLPAGPATRAPAEEREAERGLRGLVGSGSSQVGPGAALRARDAARPTDADLAAAVRDLVIIRRNWVPRESLPGRQ